MRKHIKAQVQEMLSDLATNLRGLTQLIPTWDREETLDVLTQMQELIISIGDTIENWEGMENEITPKLEGACELLYQISCSLDEEETWQGKLQELIQLIDTVQGDVEEKIPIKLEVAFFPYHVSMWDSLESVWMAASKDENVECYVIPIPYYDVEPDDTLGERHYHGSCYPDYVPIVPYGKYSVKERKPDIIFIHNPYDETNSVTRVPEEYYARSLKQYTDMLVYIPYFVSEESGPAEFMCCLPGVLYADRVAVQPGRIYEKYCRIYTEALQRNGVEEYFVPAEKKFLPLGSPKFDKIWNTACEMEDLSESWRKVILKPDGSRKKVIFYNLSINAFLQEPLQMLKKIDNVMAFFKERQSETALLWRPHPLLMDAIDSMAPLLRQEYRERIKRFQEEGWGIYDDTPDPNLAMALSDGYYGDPSSLLIIYRETGKPILLQDADILD